MREIAFPDLASSDARYAFGSDGVVLVEGAVGRSDLATMRRVFPQLGPRHAGVRNKEFGSKALSWLRGHAGLNALASFLCGPRAHAVRYLAFDKSDAANWFVPWHQDRAADGRERPVEELELMVALRIHLDDCDAENGPLEVLPGTHRRGRLEAAQIGALVRNGKPRVCLARCGDVIAMRPLAVHRSQRAANARHRRVVHIEYISSEAPHVA